MVRRVIKFIGSRSFAIYIMNIMFILLLLGSIFPSPSTLPLSKLTKFEESYPLIYRIGKVFDIHSMVSSPFFIIIPVFLFTSILICTAGRIANFFRKKTFADVHEDGVEIASEEKFKDIQNLLIKKRWRTRDGHIFFRGEIGFFGSIIFHTGMIIIFVGISLSIITNFRASLLLVEGRRTSLGEEGFWKVIKKSFLVRPANDLFFTLLKFNSKYDNKGTPTEYSINILFEDEYANISEKKIGINAPFSYSGFQATLQRGGITPHFVIKDPDGRTVFDAEVNLFAGDFFDMFNVYKEGVTVFLKFFPDMRLKDKTPVLVSRELKKPGFLIDIRTKDNDRFEGAAYVGEELQLGDYLITVKGLKHWAEIEISSDYGLKIILSGIITVIIGLLLRFIDFDRWIFLKIKDGKVYASGRARFFNEIFMEELNKIINELRERNGKY